MKPYARINCLLSHFTKYLLLLKNSCKHLLRKMKITYKLFKLHIRNKK